MIAQLFLPGLIAFVLVMGAAYAGTMRALDVYFDPEQDSIFLSEDAGPPDRP